MTGKTIDAPNNRFPRNLATTTAGLVRFQGQCEARKTTLCLTPFLKRFQARCTCMYMYALAPGGDNVVPAGWCKLAVPAWHSI